jgi:serine/threonine protein kinase
LIGQTLSQFKITAKLGEGGMGAVYRAEDSNLGREVALKILPEAFVDDAERFARFQREAHVLASLNHPNIAAIYDLAEADGVHFLVLELAEGEDLAARLARGRMATEDALAIAGKISEALEAAHEKGIVHRDLKPANVMVSPQGTVKVLDFGLAKAWEAEKADDASLSLSPTLTAQMTQAGVILGTASYMSPEQARGLTVDRRSDIWAFGVMLLEMLTGTRTFEGETVTDILAAVVRADPDLTAVEGTAPRQIRWLLRRCLDKDPTRRLRDIGEARVLLDDAARGGPEVEEEATVPAPTASGDSSWLKTAALVLVVGALAFFLGRQLTSPAPDTSATGLDTTLMVRKLTFLPGLENEPSVSPDSNYVAYVSNEAGNLDIVVLPLSGGSHTPIVTDPADDAQPAWSPDGTQIAFASARDHGGRLSVMTGVGPLTQFIFSNNSDIFVAPAFGGPAAKLIDNASHPAWSPDGELIAFESNRSGSWQIWTVPSRGGTPTQLTNESGYLFQPAFSPDGKWVAYANLRGISVVPSSGGESRQLTADQGSNSFSPVWAPDGKTITFAKAIGGRFNLWRIPFDERGTNPTASQERVTLGNGDDVEADYGSDGRLLAYSTVKFSPDVWELDPESGET